MILGIGVDLAQVARIEASLARFGERFARRILCPEELAELHASHSPAHYLAKRFAAKEAAVKALGSGFRDGIWFDQIRVTRAPGGQPGLEFRGRAGEEAARRGVAAAHLSLSDERDHALAFVVLEGG